MMDDQETRNLIFGGVIAFVMLVLLVLLLNGTGLIWNRVASPYAEETRKLTYDESRQFQQGTNRDLARYCREWREATGAGKSAVADLIRTTADTYQGALTPANQACLSEIGQ